MPINDGVSREPDDPHWMTAGALYFADEHGKPTLGLKLIAGRNFNAEEIVVRNDLEGKPPAAVIVSKALASKLFPREEALGKSIYLVSQQQKTPIVGIVDRLQEPWVSGGNRYAENAMLQPIVMSNSTLTT